MTIPINGRLKFNVNPPMIEQLLPFDELKYVPAAVGIHPDVSDNATLLLRLNLIARAIKVGSQSPQSPLRYIIGVTSVTIDVSSDQSKLLNYTRAMTIHVKYEAQIGWSQKRGIKFSPEGKLKVGVKELSVSAGDVDVEAGTQRSVKAAFEVDEALLSPSAYAKAISWQLDTPGMQKISRDYMTGNLVLDAEFELPDVPRAEGSSPKRLFRGQIRISPTLEVFTINNERMGRLHSMMIVLIVGLFSGRSPRHAAGYSMTLQAWE